MKTDCIVYKTADFIGKKWTLLIILELSRGKKRYNELKKGLLNITPKILSLRLKELEKEKLITKTIDDSIKPIKCEYKLTKSGYAFIPIIQDMKSWALKYKFKNKTCEETDCEKCF